MSFFRGFIKEAATNVTDMLKEDMKRTDERAEGMAQYRVTRRRAEQERIIKDKKEVENALNKLATLVDNDIDKAAQLYVAGGKSVAGADALYLELKKNMDAGIDVGAATTFAQSRAQPGQMTDYLKEFVTPITKLPDIEGEAAAGAGLYGAIFKPDLKAEVMRQVEAEAPLGDTDQFEGTATGAAAIDRTGFLAAKEQARKEKVEGQEDKTFEIELRTKRQALNDAKERLKLAQKEGDIKQAELEIKQAEQDIAETRSKQATKLFKQQMKEGALTIKEKEIAIQKAKDHPEFTTFEALAVYASTNLARPDLTTAQRNEYNEMLQSSIDNALKLDPPGTEGDTLFSDDNLNTIFQSTLKNALEPVGLVNAVGEEVKDLLEGNEAKFFSTKLRAINTYNNTFKKNGIVPSRVQQKVEAEKIALSEQIQEYGARATDPDYMDGKTYTYTDNDTFNSKIDKLLPSSKDKNDAIQKYGQELKVGSVVQMNVGNKLKFAVWTGTRFQF